MESNSNVGEEACFLQPKKDQAVLRRVFSDDSIKTDQQLTKPPEVLNVSCECCRIAEECTPTYILRVKENYYGKWLCGLCSEAVQEKKRKYQKFSSEQALEAHMAICKQFNRNTRVNPELSLADAMINFARKRSQIRAKKNNNGSYSSRPERSYSCGPSWFGVNNTELDSH